jgi:hypothetical protein
MEPFTSALLIGFGLSAYLGLVKVADKKLSEEELRHQALFAQEEHDRTQRSPIVQTQDEWDIFYIDED